MKQRKGRAEANNSAVGAWGQVPVGTELRGPLMVILAGAVWRWLRELWSRGEQSKGFSGLLRWSVGRHAVPPVVCPQCCCSDPMRQSVQSRIAVSHQLGDGENAVLD